MQARFHMLFDAASLAESFQGGWATDTMLLYVVVRLAAAIRHCNNSKWFALDAQSGWSWQAKRSYGEEAQDGSNMICYLIVCNP